MAIWNRNRRPEFRPLSRSRWGRANGAALFRLNGALPQTPKYFETEEVQLRIVAGLAEALARGPLASNLRQSFRLAAYHRVPRRWRTRKCRKLAVSVGAVGL